MHNQTSIPTLKPRIQMLSGEQIKEIHNTSLDILARTGLVMKNERARSLLLDAGAQESNGRVMIPEHLIMDAIASAPSRMSLYTRTGELTMSLEDDNVFFGTGSDCIFTYDLESGERRTATAEDIRRIAQLCDGLEQIDFVMSMGNPSDVPVMDVYIHSFISMLRGSSKPICYTANNRTDMEDIYAIACAVVGGEQELVAKPFLIFYGESISPLLYPDESVDKLLFCAEKGIPVTYPPSPNTGGGGPVSLAGALALGNAECLVGLLLTQLVRKGTPFLYGMNTAALDMKTSIVAYGAPEWPTGMAAWCDLARHYDLPVWGAAGASDSKIVDAQAGIEATVTIMAAFLSRCNFVHDVGYIEFGTTASMEMIVMVDEIIREVRFIMEGVEVSERTLAREAIGRVIPGSGFLADDHTLDNWRWAQWLPKLIDRSRYDNWVEAGSKSLSERANDRARTILTEHRVAPLPEAAEQAISEVLKRRKAGAEGRAGR